MQAFCIFIVLCCLFKLYLVRTNTTKIRALGPGKSLFWPAVGVVICIKEGELLGNGKPWPKLAGFLHHLLAVSSKIKVFDQSFFLDVCQTYDLFVLASYCTWMSHTKFSTKKMREDNGIIEIEVRTNCRI